MPAIPATAMIALRAWERSFDTFRSSWSGGGPGPARSEPEGKAVQEEDRQRAEGEQRGQQEGVIVGEDIGFARQLLAEQRHALGVEQAAVGDDLAVGAGWRGKRVPDQT
jgi:hypothetical protein